MSWAVRANRTLRRGTERPSRLSAVIKTAGADLHALDKHTAAVGTLEAGYANFYKGSKGVFQSCERIWFEFLVHYQCIYVKTSPLESTRP